VGKKVRVSLHGFLQKYITIDKDATEGAVVGVNLFWPDGEVVGQSEIDNDEATGGAVVLPPGVVNPPGTLPPTSWDQIIDVPDELDELINLSGNGIVVHNNDTFLTRSIVPKDERITVTDGDGVAGNPTIGLYDWPSVKESVESGVTAIIQVGFQLIVNRQFDVVGTLDCQGTLVVL